MKLNNETKIGLLVAVALLFLSWMTFKSRDFSAVQGSYEIKADFYNTEGLEVNSPVTLNGLEVGRVQDIKLVYGDETKVRLSLKLKDNVRVYPGTKVYIKNMGLMGEKYVAILSKAGKGDFLPSGSVIIGEEPASFEKILGDSQIIAANLKEISERINERLRVNSQAIDTILIEMSKSMTNISSISGNLDMSIKNNKDLIDDFMVNLDSASQNLEELSFDLKVNPWKLMYKPKKEMLKAQDQSLICPVRNGPKEK